MDPELYKAARKGNVEFLRGIASSDIEERLLILSPLKNNVLHIAAKLGHELFCQRVLEIGPQSLLCQKNGKGETPLHIAAGAGHLRIVKLLASCYRHPLSGVCLESDFVGDTADNITRVGSKSRGDLEGGKDFETLWKMQNVENNTPLHLALINRHEDVALHILGLENGLACGVNSAGESPLFLAVEASCYSVIWRILEQDESSFSLEGPNGQNPLHCAITVESPRSTNFLLRKIPRLVKEKDNDGKTALHYAVVDNSIEMIRLLLENDASAAYIVDDEGLSPLLLAAESGTAIAVRAILCLCPDSIEMLDMNERNALHLAVEYNTLHVATELLKTNEIRELINEVDIEGNTPMHLATKNHHYWMVKCLISIKGIQLNAKNKQGLTALDICESEWVLSFRQRLIWRLLEKNKVSRAKQGNRQGYMKFKGTPDILTHPKADLKQMASTLVVVATLLATVTFAAAFTIPGGYHSEGPNSGVAVFVTKAAFKAFIFTDAIAMCCSITVVFLLVWAMLGDPTFLYIAVGISTYILHASLFATLAAFMTGIYVVISSRSLWLAILVCVMCSTVPYLVSKLRDISSVVTPNVFRAQRSRRSGIEVEN